MEFKVTLPDWAIVETEQLPDCIPDLEERMRTVIRFSSLNVQHQTGGPFAAGVFERESGKVISIGVNRVVPASVSSAHAEIVTLSLASRNCRRLIWAVRVCRTISWSLTGDLVRCVLARFRGRVCEAL